MNWLREKVWRQGRDRMCSRTTSCPTVHKAQYTHIKLIFLHIVYSCNMQSVWLHLECYNHMQHVLL